MQCQCQGHHNSISKIFAQIFVPTINRETLGFNSDHARVFNGQGKKSVLMMPPVQMLAPEDNAAIVAPYRAAETTVPQSEEQR